MNKTTTQKKRFCAGEGCNAQVTGRMVYCSECRRNRKHKAAKERYERTKGQPKTTKKYVRKSKPTSEQSMHDLTDDLQIMREMGFTSYGQLSTWRRNQNRMNG